jgi:hypothetical protein
MMLGSGLSPGLAVSVGSLLPDFQTNWQQFKYYSSFITGFESGFLIIIILSFISLFFINYTNRNIRFLLIHHFVLLIIIIIHPLILGNFLPERSIGFIVILPVGMIAILFSSLQQHFRHQIPLFSVCIILMIILSYQAHHHNFLNWSKRLDQKAYKLFQKLKEENISQVYNDCRNFDYFIPAIEYYSSKQHHNIVISSSDPHSIHYQSKADKGIYCFVSCKNETPIDSNHSTIIFEANGTIIYKNEN